MHFSSPAVRLKSGLWTEEIILQRSGAASVVGLITMHSKGSDFSVFVTNQRYILGWIMSDVQRNYTMAAAAYL